METGHRTSVLCMNGRNKPHGTLVPVSHESVKERNFYQSVVSQVQTQVLRIVHRIVSHRDDACSSCHIVS